MYYIFCHPTDQLYADQLLAHLKVLSIDARQIDANELSSVKPENVIVLMSSDLFGSKIIYCELHLSMLYIFCRHMTIPSLLKKYFSGGTWYTVIEDSKYDRNWESTLRYIEDLFPQDLFPKSQEAL